MQGGVPHAAFAIPAMSFGDICSVSLARDVSSGNGLAST